MVLEGITFSQPLTRIVLLQELHFVSEISALYAGTRQIFQVLPIFVYDNPLRGKTGTNRLLIETLTPKGILLQLHRLYAKTPTLVGKQLSIECKRTHKIPFTYRIRMLQLPELEQASLWFDQSFSENILAQLEIFVLDALKERLQVTNEIFLKGTSW